MDPINNSRMKEQMRLNNNAEANRKASEIDSRVLREINALKPEKKPEATGYIIGGVLLGWVIGAFTGGLIGFVVGFLIPIGMWGAACGKVNDTNANIERRVKEIQAKGNADKKKAQKEEDMKTQKEAAAYDTEIRKYCDRAMAKADLFTPMIDHQEMMFQRMISHADHGSNMAFVEADLVYTVINTGITYTYHDSRYSNSIDDFNFSKKRFRDLHSPEECEGLAFALARMTLRRMKQVYPAQSMRIEVSHNDAEVTMHYRGANPNYVPPKDIF